jgi:hypothetical protein
LEGGQTVGSDEGQFTSRDRIRIMLMKGEPHGQEEIKKERQEERREEKEEVSS